MNVAIDAPGYFQNCNENAASTQWQIEGTAKTARECNAGDVNKRNAANDRGGKWRPGGRYDQKVNQETRDYAGPEIKMYRGSYTRLLPSILLLGRNTISGHRGHDLICRKW